MYPVLIVYHVKIIYFCLFLAILDFLIDLLSFRPFTNMSMMLSNDLCNMTMIELLFEMFIKIEMFINSSYYAFLFNNYTLNYSTSYTLVITAKIVTGLFVLILIRGGVPRYRYDFLTKLG